MGPIPGQDTNRGCGLVPDPTPMIPSPGATGGQPVHASLSLPPLFLSSLSLSLTKKEEKKRSKEKMSSDEDKRKPKKKREREQGSLP